MIKSAATQNDTAAVGAQFIAPEVEAVEAAVADKALVAKVNIDDLPDLTTRYNVKAVPTFIVFKAGKEISRFTGFKTRKDLLAALGAI